MFDHKGQGYDIQRPQQHQPLNQVYHISTLLHDSNQTSQSIIDKANTLAIQPPIRIRKSSFSSPLHYLSFTNGQSTFAALIDSGSQLNLIDIHLLPYLEFDAISHPVETLAGVSGRKTSISKWISIVMTINVYQAYTIPLAVVSHLPCSILLGMPFLKQIHATHDIVNAFLQTPAGPIQLIEPSLDARRPSSHNVQQTTYSELPPTLLDDSNLTDDEKKQVELLLKEYSDLWRNGRLGEAVAVAHQIRLVHPYPIVQKPRPVTEEQKRVIKEEIDIMLRENVIRPSHSPYAQEVVLVLKNTGDWRFCVDYRSLNKATVPDAYPLPRISDLIGSIKRSKFFATLDLKAGYWQIPMQKDSIKYTAFRCFLGLYEFCVMPYGLTNAPATFQRCMDFLFGDHRFQGILCYLDDILVHATSFPRALELLRLVLERLRRAGLTINLNKSRFFPRTLKYLGQIIQDGQIIPDPKRVASLRQIKTPTTIRDVRSLLGFLGYYQTHIRNQAEILAPVYELLRATKNSTKLNSITPVIWTDTHTAAIHKAIDVLAESVLTTPLDEDIFQVETDASSKSVAGILSVRRDDEWKPVEFYSKTLSNTQRNWPVREKEAYAIVMSLQKFDPYVRGRPTTLLTDHESLKWMLDCPKGKIARWASIIAEYPVTILYKKGSEMVPVDFLTRFLDEEPDPLEARMCFFTTTEPIPQFNDIVRAQQEEPIPNLHGFSTHNHVIYYHGSVYAPKACRREIIAACHSTAPFHHPGIKKTKHNIQRTFNWPNLHKDVIEYIQACLYCRRARSGRERLQGLQKTHPIPTAFHTIYMDFWQVNYNHNKHKLLTLIDQLTKWAECIPVPDATAQTVANIVIHQWIYRFGAPSIIVSDRDKAFTSELFKYITSTFGVKHIVSTPYHPEGNATVESFHRTLSTGLRFFNSSITPFHEALSNILFGYRSTIHSTTGHSPSFMLYGQDLKLAPDADWRLEADPEAAERLKFLSTLRLDVQLKAQQRLAIQSQYQNAFREPTTFTEGQLVLLHLQPLQQLHYKASMYKAYPRWSFPHRVIKVLPNQVTAIVKCLITQACRQIHIQDARFILPPTCDLQQQEWLQLVKEEVLTMFDPPQAAEVVKSFFEALRIPQLSEDASSPLIASPKPRKTLSSSLKVDSALGSQEERKRPRTDA